LIALLYIPLVRLRQGLDGLYGFDCDLTDLRPDVLIVDVGDSWLPQQRDNQTFSHDSMAVVCDGGVSVVEIDEGSGRNCARWDVNVAKERLEPSPEPFQIQSNGRWFELKRSSEEQRRPNVSFDRDRDKCRTVVN
jgi:hypothetical protein